jgi:hypothetical protein
MRRRRSRLFSAGLLLGLLGIPAAIAQTTGSIEGLVQDVSGGALQGAAVGVWSESLQGSRVAATGRDGKFWIPGLPPGTYTVRVTLPGFRQGEKSVLVALDAKATFSVVLEPAVEEAVAVSGRAPLVDATSTTGGTNYTASVISSLPVQRDYTDIVRSNPGVDTDQGPTQGRSTALTIYGATSAENQWIVDGVNTTNVRSGQQGKFFNTEFVQEVEVKTGGYGAEYGGALGGLINVVTKSGGNQFHGDSFVYYDSNATVAAPYYGPNEYVARDMQAVGYQRFDYGLDVGGYLIKDRLWFFGAYNRVNGSGEVSRVEATEYVSTSDRFPLDLTDNLVSGKLTWNAAATTTFVATALSDPSTKSGASGADPRSAPGDLWVTPIWSTDPATWYAERHYGGTDYGLRATQLFGTSAFLVLQAAEHRDRNTIAASNIIRLEDLTCDPSLPPGTPDAPCEMPVNPRSVTGGYGWLDGEAANNQSRQEQYRGDLTFSAGAHELKAGGDYRDGRTLMTYACTGAQCAFLVNDFGKTYYVHRFAASGGDDPRQLPDGRFRARARNAGAYLQDSWRVGAGLTVSLGLRWGQETLQNYEGKTVLDLANQWQPRVGVVWDPWKDGRTKVYAAAGRYYFDLPTVAMTWWFGNVTGMDSYSLDPVSTTPDPTARGLEDDSGYWTWFGGTPWGVPVDAHLKATYQNEVTAGVERLLDPSLVVGMKATYRALGNILEDRCDLDPNRNDGNTCAIINPGSGERYARGDFFYCQVLDDDNCSADQPLHGAEPTPPARRYYRGIELLTRKSIGDALWVQASYVYSSLRGNYDGGINETYYESHPGGNIDFNTPSNWRNATGHLYLDRPHHFRLDGYWNTPWRLSLGLQAFVESGAPTNKLTFVCGWCAPGYLVPRGSEGRLPTEWEANLSIAYSIPVGPATVSLLGAIYNLFNNQIVAATEEGWSSTQRQENYPGGIFDPSQPQTNEDYGKVTGRSSPRYFRAAVRVSF